VSRLEEIRARAAAATPGPWHSNTRWHKRYAVGVIEPDGSEAILTSLNDYFTNFAANGDFIAHAREDIPYLLAKLKECEEALERIYRAPFGYTEYMREDARAALKALREGA
jgi:hypothetical protein